MFGPILAGATASERARACVGAGVAVLLVAAQGAVVHGTGWASPWLVAPVGAAAVLVFAVPTSPMAQPWPVVFGNAISALIGVAVGRLLGHGTLECGLTLALAMVAMSLTRSLHPPGGAAALTGVLGGVDWLFPLAPLAMNLAVLVVLGWAFHRLGGHTYPHVPAPAAGPALAREDVAVALEQVGEAFDVSPEDLRALLSDVEAIAAARARDGA